MKHIPELSFVAAFAVSAAAEGLEIRLAGPQPVGSPVGWKAEQPLSDSAYVLIAADGKTIPAQLDSKGHLWWWQEPFTGDIIYKLDARPVRTAEQHVKVQPAGEGRIEVIIDGKPFTALNFRKDDPKPYLYPVIGPTGEPITRDYPMKDSPEEKAEKAQDHPHHRSIWTAHGDVRLGAARKGNDYWSEKKGHGVQKVRRIVRTVSGPVFGQIVAEVDWVSADGRRDLTDTRTYTFFRDSDDARYIDYRIVLEFPEGDTTFHDTKEGGILSIRVAASMDEQAASGPKGMRYNSRGQSGDATWGQPAEWCDYVGPVGGKTVGIAVFDAPVSFRHPARWHIRNYGLFTANPFGEADFTGSKDRGHHTFKKGEKAEFSYRIVIHKGDTKAAAVAEQYRLFTGGPKVSIRE